NLNNIPKSVLQNVIDFFAYYKILDGRKNSKTKFAFDGIPRFLNHTFANAILLNKYNEWLSLTSSPFPFPFPLPSPTSFPYPTYSPYCTVCPLNIKNEYKLSKKNASYILSSSWNYYLNKI